ncbi:unnamed protein product [Ectocarpus sp. 12 AP-2014]
MTTAAEVDKVPVAVAKDVISSIFGSAACVYTGQVSFLLTPSKCGCKLVRTPSVARSNA